MRDDTVYQAPRDCPRLPDGSPDLAYIRALRAAGWQPELAPPEMQPPDVRQALGIDREPERLDDDDEARMVKTIAADPVRYGRLLRHCLAAAEADDHA